VEALEGEFAGWLCLHQVFTVPRKRRATRIWPVWPRAEAGGEVGGRCRCPVVPAPLEADGADGGIALREPMPQASRNPVCASGRSSPPGGPAWPAPSGRPARRVGHRHRIVEEIIMPSPVKRSRVPSCEDQAAHLA